MSKWGILFRLPRCHRVRRHTLMVQCLPLHEWMRLSQWTYILFVVTVLTRSSVIAKSFTSKLSHCLYMLLLASALGTMRRLCFIGVRNCLTFCLLKFSLVCSLFPSRPFSKQQWKCSFPVQSNNYVLLFKVARSVHNYNSRYYSWLPHT